VVGGSVVVDGDVVVASPVPGVAEDEQAPSIVADTRNNNPATVDRLVGIRLTAIITSIITL